MNWQEILRENYRDWRTLADFLELNEEQREQIFENLRFPLNLPRRLAEKIEKGTLEDPILKQFVPLKLEQVERDGFSEDPVGELGCQSSTKLLQKYQGRALLVSTSACAMHCRYCFRQHFNYDVQRKGFEEELNQIKNDLTLQEVILSGGDPLSLSNRALGEFLEEVDQMDHISRIRFHTRFPVGIPERIDDEFLEMLSGLNSQVWFVIHCNHSRELDEDVLGALKAVQCTGATVLNQAVLLRGVNDTIEALRELCEILASHGILPYYLHQLDPVQGASHFEVPISEGKELIKVLASQISGYAVPKYVQEIPGESGKSPIE